MTWVVNIETLGVVCRKVVWGDDSGAVVAEILRRTKGVRLRMTMVTRGLGEPRIFLSGDGREDWAYEVEG